MLTYLATMGERPEAITVALDRLMARGYDYERVVLLHTDPLTSQIAEPLERLREVLAADYSHIRVYPHELVMPNGAPIIDIQTQTEANAYYDAVLQALNHYKRDGQILHLMVSGGRKAMSIYATLAAQIVFGPDDKVWTVLSPPRMLVPEQWHVPPGQQDAVQVVDMPLVMANLPDGTDPLTYARRRRGSRRSAFLALLSTREREVVEAVWSQPDMTVAAVAQQLGKTEKTVENQLTSIYSKMAQVMGDVTHRRAALIRLLNEEE